MGGGREVRDEWRWGGEGAGGAHQLGTRPAEHCEGLGGGHCVLGVGVEWDGGDEVVEVILGNAAVMSNMGLMVLDWPGVRISGTSGDLTWAGCTSAEMGMGKFMNYLQYMYIQLYECLHGL